MSEDVTADRDGVAAEYVLGTLDLQERREAQALLAQDSDFAAKVKLWERRLGELHLMVEPVEPAPDLWPRIKGKLPQPPPKPQPELEAIEPAAEPKLPPEFQFEPAAVPEPSPPEPSPPEPQPESKPHPADEEVARKTAAEVNFESAIAAVESALASHGAATAARLQAPTVDIQETVAQASVPAPPDDRPVVSAAPAPDAGLVAVPPPQPAPAADERLRAAARQLAGWRTLALLLAVVILALAGLVALWKFAPQRLPLALQPAELMRRMGIEVAAAPPGRRPAPPESQYDE